MNSATGAVLGCVSQGTSGAPLVIGHRGYPAVAPENTLSSFRAAIAAGAKWVETDGQVTKDAQVVLMHDPTLDRTTNVKTLYPARSPWNIKDFTYAEIQQLDAGSWFGAKFVGEPVPLLSDLLSLLTQAETGLLLEIKSGGLTDPDAIAMVLNSAGWVAGGLPTHQFCVNSFFVQSAQRFKRQLPDVEVQVIVSGAMSAATLQTVNTFADGLMVSWDALSSPVYSGPERVLRSVFAWTVDNPTDLTAIFKYPVAGVITNNYPVMRAAVTAAKP
ncbi:glycerophosphodiester phosphodiesterase family protein [Ramlibacter sp.]|uniref:glycerophosphodiester phosphodiesterase n=1 Tax=Ramlibacter sp. TaxID=1917967 RepID=UPI002602065D|nr:glycerophosphodiester phosphodiesterase family protein [Ramlibacter sp.]MDB5957097.1 glycerophosphodiester phosphodiesterase [Ramlibacter sp.]